MSMYEYIVKTPFSQMVADWKEYRELCAKRDRLKSERDFRYRQIDKEFEGSNVRCMRREKTGRKAVFENSYIRYCSCFFEKKCDKSCPQWFRHDRYWKMYDELKDVRNRLGEFWNTKFQNVK